MGTAMIRPSFVILTSGHSGAHGWASQCPDVKNYNWRLNPVWHRMLYGSTHMAPVGVKGLQGGTAMKHWSTDADRRAYHSTTEWVRWRSYSRWSGSCQSTGSHGNNRMYTSCRAREWLTSSHVTRVSEYPDQDTSSLSTDGQTSFLSHFYRATLRRARDCYGKSSVCLWR